MTDEGKFYFYTSRPELASRSEFNDNCVRREADSPILGCYTYQRIYVYDITDEKLDGIEEVTAAHEMLHAVYDRLTDAEKNELADLLQKDYVRLKDADLVERMKYYEKHEPGEENNELYAILGTEFRDLSNELEEHYSQYFSNRLAIVQYHDTSHTIFAKLSDRSKAIASEIDSLVDTINADTKSYNSAATDLSERVHEFNTRADSQNGFSSQSEFDAERAALLLQVEELKRQRVQITIKIANYEALRDELEAVAAESEALNRSIDSTLVPATGL